VRDASRLTYTYPINRSHSIPSVAAWATPELEARGIEVETFFNAESVDPDRKVLTSMEGTELPFDLLIAIPEHRSAAFLEASGLTKHGWVPTDRETLAVKGFDGIWALGDTTDLPTSKAGSVAHYQAATVAKNVVAFAHGNDPVARYDGKTICFIEAGLDRATFLEFDYARAPAPKPPTKLVHWAKLAYNRAYWLTARGAL
jgi:sulfide:quinone oxidoreductase